MKIVISITLFSSLLILGCADTQEFSGESRIQKPTQAEDAAPSRYENRDNETESPVPSTTANAPSETAKLEQPDDAVQEASFIEAPEKPQDQSSEALNLRVSLPADQLRAGGGGLQAKAELSGENQSTIVWKIEGPAGHDLGEIDDNGLYTSPDSLSEELNVFISASLADNPGVSDKKPLKLIPAQQLFVGCKLGSNVFPITAEVYDLPVGIKNLPSFSGMSKSATVCMDKYDVPNQAWDAGFPGSPNLVEWFGLHTSTNIHIPADGDYQFRLGADDGAILYIDGAMVIDNSGQHPMQFKNGSKQLKAGKHKLVIDWYQGPRVYLGLQLFWKLPGSTKFEIVPTGAFSP